MEIKSIMRENIAIVSPDMLLHEVIKQMTKHDCDSILVGKNDRLIGMITDKDIALRCIAESHHHIDTTAEKVMTKEILYCIDTDKIKAVAQNMVENKLRRMTVLDKDKKLVGIVSLSDLIGKLN